MPEPVSPYDRKKLGDAIRKAMKLRGVSQTVLADLVGVHQTQVSKWVRGENSPDIFQFMAIAKALEVGVGQIAIGAPESPLPSDEAAILDVFRSLGLTRTQAIDALTVAAKTVSIPAPTGQPRLVRLLDETDHQLRLQAENRRKEREAAREAAKEKQSAKPPDRT